MNEQKQHKHQLIYFKKEFSAINEYQLTPWQESYIRRIKKNMLRNNYKKKTLLDIATGSGYVAVEMAKLGLKVIACDLSLGAVKNIRKYKKQFSLTNLIVIRCNAEKIPLKDKSVDYIVANAILEHIVDEQKAINEWKRLVKDGGRVFITVPITYKYIFPFLWIINYIHDKRIGHLRRYDLGSLQRKFNLHVLSYFYSGHLIKVFGLLFSIFFNTHKCDQFFENYDRKDEKKAYGSNNISVIFQAKN